jgi:hypothetical protein
MLEEDNGQLPTSVLCPVFEDFYSAYSLYACFANLQFNGRKPFIILNKDEDSDIKILTVLNKISGKVGYTKFFRKITRKALKNYMEGNIAKNIKMECYWSDYIMPYLIDGYNVET